MGEGTLEVIWVLVLTNVAVYGCVSLELTLVLVLDVLPIYILHCTALLSPAGRKSPALSETFHAL